MSSQKKRQTSTIQFHYLLIALLFIIVGGSAALFYFTMSKLDTFASTVNKSVVEANASSHTLTDLQTTEANLKKNKDAIKDASKIVAKSQSYQYQNQIINDLNRYANKSGISINQFNFEDEAATSSSSSQSSSNKPAPKTVGGLKSTTVGVTLDTPIPYKNLLRFIKATENNLTNMQLDSLTLSNDSAGKNSVSVDTLNIKVYIK